MADDAQQRYAAILGAMVGALRSPWGARVRWVREIDEGDEGGAYLLCVSVGTPTMDADGEHVPAEVFGCVLYADGRQDGPTPVLEERRNALLEGVGLSV